MRIGQIFTILTKISMNQFESFVVRHYLANCNMFLVHNYMCSSIYSYLISCPKMRLCDTSFQLKQCKIEATVSTRANLKKKPNDCRSLTLRKDKKMKLFGKVSKMRSHILNNDT